MQSHRRRQSPFPVAATLSSRAAGQAFGSILLLLSVILAFDTARAQNARAEGASTTILTDGNAVVTGFSGVQVNGSAQNSDDHADRIFIDLNGPVARIVDMQDAGARPQAQIFNAQKPFTLTAGQIGQVFGITLDDAIPPNVYLAATSAYGLPIVAPGPRGQQQYSKVGATNATFMPGLWGPQGGPGSVWKVDGVTGKVSLFANVMLGSRTNSGPALGGLAFDPNSRSFSLLTARPVSFIASV